MISSVPRIFSYLSIGHSGGRVDLYRWTPRHGFQFRRDIAPYTTGGDSGPIHSDIPEFNDDQLWDITGRIDHDKGMVSLSRPFRASPSTARATDIVAEELRDMFPDYVVHEFD